MANYYEELEQTVDHRGSLPQKGNLRDRTEDLGDCARVWHHGLTRKNAGGSDAASYARFHVYSHGWPRVGYHFIIEPKNTVSTSKGERARIVWCNSPRKKSYHIGNNNNWGVGICVAGDYRYDELDEPTKASIDELHDALVADGIGNRDVGHSETPGYSWKSCCVFDYDEAIHFLDGHQAEAIPGTYEMQEGDTLWSVANENAGVSVDDIIEANSDLDPSNIKVGTVINLGDAKNKAPKDSEPSSGTLREGDRGDNVALVQRSLIKAGYNLPKYGVDGDYGQETEDAVKELQKDAGITVDGIYGPNTRKALKEAKADAADKKDGKLPTGYYSRGDEGSDVRKIQEGLASVYYYPNKSASNNGVDGIYGPNTENAVERFQRMHDCTVDGKYGPETRQALLAAMD